jgi:hypothetical protein
MNYAIDMSSGATIYIPSFIKTGSGTRKLLGGIHIQRAGLSHKPIFIFFKISKVC